jgi:predicted O-methyltransferase YrrM
MNKFQKLIQGMAILIKKPFYINKLINDNDAWGSKFKKRFPHFARGLKVIDLPDVIQTHNININCYTFLNGGSLITDLALLKGLAKTIPECKYFEIGTWRGESVVNVAENAAQCYTLNLSDNEMMQIHGDRRIIDQTAIFIAHQPNIKRIEANTLDFDFSVLKSKFDLIFIDGDHKYSAICNDTKKVFEHLCHEKSIVVWHDYSYSPDELRFEVMSAILDSVPQNLHQFLYHVRNTNCCMFNKTINASTQPLEYPDYPYYNFKIELSIESDKAYTK